MIKTLLLLLFKKTDLFISIMSNTEKIEEQIKTQYTKAFFDMILEDLSRTI